MGLRICFSYSIKHSKYWFLLIYLVTLEYCKILFFFSSKTISNSSLFIFFWLRKVIIFFLSNITNGTSVILPFVKHVSSLSLVSFWAAKSIVKYSLVFSRCILLWYISFVDLFILESIFPINDKWHTMSSTNEFLLESSTSNQISKSEYSSTMFNPSAPSNHIA